MRTVLLSCALLGLMSASSVSRADEELAQRASWAPVPAEQVKAKLDEWLAGKKPDAKIVAEIAALWPADKMPSAGPETLERLALSLGLADPAVRDVVNTCRAERLSPMAPKFASLTDEKIAPFARHNLRLLFGRWLAQNDLYDEAIEQFNGLTPADVVDPATLLFYQSVAYHRLLDKQNFTPAIKKLMENEKQIPRRYQTLAKLMEADIAPLKTDSLDEVSRLMDDIRRRLDLGRAGKKVRKEEDDVIAKLEKMIEDLEEQLKKQQQQQGQGQGSGPGSSPSSPKQDSTPGGMKGPGDVTPKDIGNKSGWGNLPPKERQEAMQHAAKELPAHFSDVMEAYSKKLGQGKK